MVGAGGPAGSVELQEVRHRYRAETGRSRRADRASGADVLQGVSVDVPAGSSLALLGPSGCGKTTLLRAIAGLERPTSGTIRIDGQLMAGPETWVPAEKRRVGLVFQDWALFPHLSVARNVAYGLRSAGFNKADRARLADESLELVGLAGLGDRMPATLSGGQQQRVALARALAPRPKVLLLDEPFSNLDTGLRARVRAEVHQLLLDVGITAVWVTHDQEEAFVLGDRVAVMHDGNIVQVDEAHRLYTRPATRWVAEFVGDASLIPAVGRGDCADGPLGRLRLADEATGPVELLIRPEHLILTQGEQGTVELVEFYGHDAMVVLRVADATIRVRTGPEPGFRRGDRVDVNYVGGPVQAFAALGQTAQEAGAGDPPDAPSGEGSRYPPTSGTAAGTPAADNGETVASG